MLIPTPEPPKKRAHTASEAAIQQKCVAWLWNTHPETRSYFFAVQNENSQSQYENKQQQQISGSRRRMMGVVSGVSDTILFMPKGGFHALCVEFKTAVGRQSPHQIEWQSKVEAQGYKYVVVRSLEEFQSIIEDYLKL